MYLYVIAILCTTMSTRVSINDISVTHLNDNTCVESLLSIQKQDDINDMVLVRIFVNGHNNYLHDCRFNAMKETLVQ
jgi:hypothetical protein